MSRLSETAAAILVRLEQNRRYEPQDVRVFAPDLSNEAIREVMHELWVHRCVERAGPTGWRRRVSHDRSGPVHAAERTGTGSHSLRPGATKVVRPEDLFDHDSFSEFFK